MLKEISRQLRRDLLIAQIEYDTHILNSLPPKYYEFNRTCLKRLIKNTKAKLKRLDAAAQKEQREILDFEPYFNSQKTTFTVKYPIGE